MRARTSGILLLVAAAHALAALPRRGEAATRVSGNTYVEGAEASRPGDDSKLVQTGVSLDVVPPTKKKLKADLNFRFNYVRADDDELANFSPLGNIGVDLAGEAFTLNAQQSRYATVSTTTQLTETKLSRASLTVAPAALPRVSATVSRTESKTGASPETTSDTGSISADYRWGWANVRAGYSADRRASGPQASSDSSARFAGLGASYEVLPATVLSGDADVNRFESRSGLGSTVITDTRSLRLNAESRPLAWLGLGGNLSWSVNDSRAGFLPSRETGQRIVDGTATLYPHPSFRLGATVGNRTFDDVQATRSVDYRILFAGFSRAIRDRTLLGLTASRSFESDPRQGENTSDTFGANLSGEVTSRISLRVNASVSRTENRSFVGTPQTFSASGTLAERDRLDTDSGGLPAGFTFFDVLNGDLYTKNSSTVGDWTLTSHLDPVVERFSANRTVQIAAVPTDRTSVSLSWSSNASAPDLAAAGRIGSQTMNGSLTYSATRRSNLGLAGILSLPETGNRAYSASASYAYRFARGHQLNLSYGQQVTIVKRTDALSTASGTRRNDNLSATWTIGLRKRTSLDVTYLASQLFRDDRTDFVRVRIGHSF